jgi:OHCU decarboxylase
MPQKITVEEVNRLGKDEFVAKFGGVFEHSPWIAERSWHERPFGGLTELHNAFLRAVYDAPTQRQIALIQAHPDLAGKAAIAGDLTPESTREQASAGLGRLSPEEYETLNRLNSAYREKFGFPLIFAVREHTKETILSGAEARLEHSKEQEIERALGEIAKIARFRLQDLVEPERSDGVNPARKEP